MLKQSSITNSSRTISTTGKNDSLPALTNEEAKRIVEAQMFFNVQHEIGHCLGIAHHDNSPTTADGVTDCLMRYKNDLEHNNKQY